MLGFLPDNLEPWSNRIGVFVIVLLSFFAYKIIGFEFNVWYSKKREIVGHQESAQRRNRLTICDL